MGSTSNAGAETKYDDYDEDGIVEGLHAAGEPGHDHDQDELTPVGIVLGALGDRSFMDSAKRGFDQGMALVSLLTSI